MEDMLRVGVITSTHGIRGEVKVFPTTDDPLRFKKLKKCVIDGKREQVAVTVSSVKFFKQFVILKFKEFDDINDIEKYKGCSLYVTREDAVRLRKDEYFVADLIGMEVFLEDGSAFGKLTDVMTTGANDVYVITIADRREILVPAIKDCILSVDPEAGRMEIHLLPGLME